MWPVNRRAVEVFVGCATQWQRTVVVGERGGVVIWQGLDYPAVRVVAEAHRVKWTRRLLDDLRVMEAAALRELNR